jgi:membrane protein
MSKKSFARLIRIVTGTFGTGRDELPPLETSLTWLERFVHFWVLVYQSFVRNRCPVRASALSYTTLLALIPMLVVAMSVSSWLLKSKGEEQIGAFIEQFIEHIVPSRVAEEDAANAPTEFASSATNGAPTLPATTATVEPVETNGLVVAESSDSNAPPAEVATPLSKNALVVAAKDRAASQIRQFIQNANSGALGSVGVVFLLWTAILMLSRIEDTFNDIWGVTRGRNWLSRIVLYWATITLGPFLLISALTLASGPSFAQTRDLLFVVPFLESLVSQLLPVVLICFTFSMLYKLVPNTKVHFTAAFAGGTLAGVSWCLFNLISLHFATSAVTASVIYGSLALVPLLMVGLYAVWLIVLFGAQVAYAFQNRESYLQEKLAENVNQRGREFVALRLMTCVGQRYDRSLPPPTISEMSRELGIPSKLIQQVLQTLLAARLVVEVAGSEAGYAPARPLEAINCHHVLLAMRATQGQDLRTREEPARAEVYGEFARIQAAEKEAASAVSMLALINRAQARPELAAPPVTAATPSVTPAPVVTELPFEPKPGGPEPKASVTEMAAIDLEPAMAATQTQPPSSQRNQAVPTEPSYEEDRDFPL